MKSTPHFSRTRMLVMGGFMSLSSVALAAPALAHHPFGGSTPTNAIQGFYQD
ncbi:hypothetical protein [Synechococcus sp. 7002]|uniref:hypothetical protein n=1 Tax=Synechococcus sp. 7002 TaxID=1938862 RepID=UPI001F2D3B91|nr:hypothetical protein [Synechococcus sp. 7002]